MIITLQNKMLINEARKVLSSTPENFDKKVTEFPYKIYIQVTGRNYSRLLQNSSIILNWITEQ